MAFVFVALPAIGEGLTGLFGAGLADAAGTGIIGGEMGDIAVGTAGNMVNSAATGGAGITAGQAATGLNGASFLSRMLGGGSGPYGYSGTDPLIGVNSSTALQPTQSLISSSGDVVAAPQVPTAPQVNPLVANPSTWTTGADAAQTYNYGNADVGLAQNATNVTGAPAVPKVPGSDRFLPDWFYNKDNSLNMMKLGGVGLGGLALGSMFSKPSLLPQFQPKTGAQVGLGSTLASNYRPIRAYAGGGNVTSDLSAPGILALNNPYSNEPDDGMSDGGVAGGNNMYPMSQQDVSHYAVPSQLPAGAHQVAQNAANMNMARMATGGISSLGSYSDGGRMLQGPGDGMSDSIPASIAGKQPARLADGEFVVSADVVSGLGNGSTDAGAKKLYAMMDKVRKARTGTKKQGKKINPDKFLKV